jgi:glycosyltransferase involved in cell wall biosynthesis
MRRVSHRVLTDGVTILHVLLTSNMAWNIAHFRKPVVDGLRADGHRVTVLSPSDRGVAMLKDMGVTHHPIDIDSDGTSPLRDAALILSYRRILKEIAPDVVLGYTIKPNIYGSIAARSLSLPFVPNVSGLGTAFMRRGLLNTVAKRLYRFAFRPLPHVIFQNAEDRDLFLGENIVTAEQPVLVPGSGIDLDHFAATPQPHSDEGGLTFLMIARLLRDKGVVEFVDAARQLRARYPRCRFQLLGDVGADNPSAISGDQLGAWVQEGCVEYLGRLDDVRPAIRAADCIVLPSYREGAPRTLIEASAMARPVVATDVPGCRQVVEDGVTGHLCRARDSVDLARALTMMIEAGQPGRARMGAAGRLKMEQEYDQSIVVDTYRRVIAQVTGQTA